MVGHELAKVDHAWQWWVGDWIRQGKKYGETYREAERITGKAKGTLQNITSVCAEFESSRRRELSFKHHAEAQSLPSDEQDVLLEQAEAENRPASWVRQQVNGDKKTSTAFERFCSLWDKADAASREQIAEFIAEFIADGGNE